MPKLPIITARKLIKILTKKGFVNHRTTGSHFIYVRVSDSKSVSIPVHSGKDLGRGITLAILKDADISTDEFMKLV